MPYSMTRAFIRSFCIHTVTHSPDLTDTCWTSHLVWYYPYHYSRHHNSDYSTTTQTDTTVIPTKTPIISPTIPLSQDYTPTSPDYSPAFDSESDPSEDPSSDHIPPLPAISLFLSSADDTTDNDTPDTPPSTNHARDSSSDSSSDFHSDASSDSSSRHSLPDHSSLDLSSTFSRPSRKRRRKNCTPQRFFNVSVGVEVQFLGHVFDSEGIHVVLATSVNQGLGVGRGFDAEGEGHSLRIPPTQGSREELYHTRPRAWCSSVCLKDVETLSKDDMLEKLTRQYLKDVVSKVRTSSNTRNQATVQNGKIKCYKCNGVRHIARQCTHPKRPQNLEYYKDKMLLMQAQENRVVLNKELLLFIVGGHTNMFDDDVDEAPVQDLALNEDNTFQADQCDAFDSDVYEAPTAQTMFMANLSSADLIYDEAGLSYDSDILSEVQDHDNYVDSVGEYHEVHAMQNDVQPNYVVDSDAEYTSDSNIIPYEQYVKDKAVQFVQSNVSSVPNDALMMIINDMHEQSAQCVSANEQNKVVNESLTAELTRYEEQEELLKKELHSVKMQLNSTINHNKLIKEQVTSLKKDFKQKENKYLKEFLDMKQLKEKVEDKLYKQDQSLQTVHMLCKPKPFYDEKKKVAIGYKNPLYLTKVKQVQHALYNGHELVKTTHAPAIVHDSEDTLELAETTRMKMIEKSKTEVEQKVVDKQCADIERKNLLIENENLIIDCLSNELLYSVMNDVNTISRFFELHDAYTLEQARYHLNLQLKYQDLKERFVNNKSQPSQDTPEFDIVFEINKMKASLHGKDNAIRKLKEQISQMNKRRSEADQNEKVKKHYKELYDSIKLTGAKNIEKTTSLLTKNEKLKAQIKGKLQCVTMPAEKPKVLAPGLYAIDVEPIPPRNRNDVWLSYLRLTKPEPARIPLWVKIYNVPLEAWNVEGISRIASRIGTPIIMDKVTTSMCKRGYGRASFARVLIEVDATEGIVDNVEIWYQKLNRTMKLRVEYAWQPPFNESNEEQKGNNGLQSVPSRKFTRPGVDPTGSQFQQQSANGLRYGRGAEENVVAEMENSGSFRNQAFDFVYTEAYSKESDRIEKLILKKQLAGGGLYMTNFLPYVTSDHCPALLVIPCSATKRKRSFRFMNYLIDKKEFHQVVKDNWNVPVYGFAMFIFSKKLKNMKRHIRELNKRNGNVYEKVKKLKDELKKIQTELDKDPQSVDLKEAEMVINNAYRDVVMDEEKVPNQKTKIEWLKEGDHNSTYFHNFLKGRLSRNTIISVEDDVGIVFYNDDVAPIFVDHFESFFGTCEETFLVEDPDGLFIKKIDVVSALYMFRDVSNDEIKAALFDIDDNKAPGPDVFPHLGLKQGDPVSPDIFTITMEVFTLMLKSQVCNEAKFKYHWGCKGLGILNLCFADDLMLFCHGDMVSASVLRRALDEFCLSSGLRPHMAKSIVYFGNVPENVKIDIMIAMPFREGSFPIRYLGIPLNANRIVRDDCTILLDKASMFILPQGVCDKINKIFKEFLWKSNGKRKIRYSVAWKDVCLQKSEGGLGLKSIYVWNEALMAKHLWNVVINKDSIWDTRFKDVLDIPVPTLSENNDEKVIWINKKGKEKNFNVNEVWKDLKANPPKERNIRLFGDAGRSNEVIFKLVVKAVRLRRLAYGDGSKDVDWSQHFLMIQSLLSSSVSISLCMESMTCSLYHVL
ncbi:retrovirus-related pol polyprotein from transposon TNT 1-94 [Tanacetum coccineum]